MRIFVARHGQTAQNRDRVLQLPEHPLSDAGLAQARALGERLGELGVEAILTSDYARARMTAEAVRDATGATLEVVEQLRERNFGDLRGTPYAQLTRDIFAPEYRPPNGEDGPMFEARVAQAWDRIVNRVESGLRGNLCVVTHGLVCRALVDRHLSGPEAAPATWGNTCLTVVEAREPWKIETLACTAHLDGLEPAASAPV